MSKPVAKLLHDLRNHLAVALLESELASNQKAVTALNAATALVREIEEQTKN